MNLSEAFKRLELLDEDVFNLTKDGLEDLKDFEEESEEEADVIDIIDPDADSEEDLKDSYIGKVILDCEVCHTDIYKDKEDITIDEETQLANVGEECPYCFSNEGFKIIGEIKPFVETTFETDDDVEVEVDDEEVEDEDDDEVEESLQEDTVKQGKYWVNKGDEGTHGKFRTKKAADEQRKAMFARGYKAESLKESKNDHNQSIQAWCQRNKKDIIDTIKEYKPNTLTNSELGEWCKEAGFENNKTNRDIFRKELNRLLRKNESLKESYNSTLGDLISGDSATLMSPFYLGKTGEVADAGSIVEVSNLTRRSSIPGGYHYKFFDKNGNLFYEDDLWLYNYDLDKNEDDSWINPDLIKVKLIESLKESCSINQCQKWVDYDMKKYKKISDDTMEKIKSSGYSVVKDQYGEYEVIADRKMKESKKKMKESIEDIVIDTGDQEISVSAKDKEEVKSDDEMIAPLSNETKDEIEMDSENTETNDSTEDIDIDEFSEEEFDELGESYLKKVYENVNNYKTTSAKIKGNKLYLEGLIKFNSGKTKKTSFIFESKTLDKNNKAKFIGENVQISRGHKSFKLTGTLNNNKFIAESLNYNYKAKDGSGNSKRVYGTVKVK